MPRYSSSSCSSDENKNSITSNTEDSYDDSSKSSSVSSRSVSPVSNSSSDNDLVTTSSDAKRKLKKLIKRGVHNYKESRDYNKKLREEIIRKRDATDNVEPSSGGFAENFRKMIYGDPNEFKSDKENVFKGAKKMKPPEAEAIFSKATEEDIVSAIHHRNIPALVYAYINNMLRKDYRDDNNNNYLHIGVEVNHGLTMKTLLLLIDDSIDLLTLTNNNGNCPIDIVKSDEMRSILLQFASERAPMSEMRADQRFRIAMIDRLAYNKSEKITKDSKIMISLDGGGIRGLCTIQTIMAIQSKMKEKLWNNVDWVFGTSTGGILALLLSLGYSFEEARKTYFKLKNDVFAKMFRPYESKKIENLLISLMGEFQTMDKIKDKKIAVTSVKHKKDTGHMHLRLFRNYYLTEPNNNDNTDKENEVKKENNGSVKYFNENYGFNNPSHNYIWKAARCTSAAPYYFHPFGEFIDGGVISNNPSVDLLTDYFRYSHLEALNANNDNMDKITDDIGCFISLGTGSKQVGMDTAIDNELKEVSTTEYWVLNRSIQIGIKAFKAIYKMMDSDDLPVERSSNWCYSIGVPFFRIQPHLESDVGLDQKDDETIMQMLWEAEIYLKSFHYYEIELLAKYLDYVIETRNNLRKEEANN
uniref:85/88 kDa calcium-independent phospholipase A2 (inferred by orthology to a human protein) n=1 Tax=Strongyloides venezuelensis TaxID=75913 RepID=A0A0K0FTR6_STRVS